MRLANYPFAPSKGGQSEKRIAHAVTNQLVQVIIVAIFVVSLILAIINWNVAKQRYFDQLHSRVEAYQRVLSQTIHEQNVEATQWVSRLIDNDPDIVGFNLTNRFDQVLQDWGEHPAEKDSYFDLLVAIPDMEYPQYTAANVIYHIRKPDLMGEVLARMGLSMVIAVMLCALLLFDLQRRLSNTIINPLRRLHHAILHRETRHELCVPNIRGPVEIVDLATELFRAFRRDRKTNERISESIAALTTVLENYGLFIRYYEKAAGVSDFGVMSEAPVFCVLPENWLASSADMIAEIKRKTGQLDCQFQDVAVGSDAGLLRMSFRCSDDMAYELTLFRFEQEHFAVVIADVTASTRLGELVASQKKIEAVGQLAGGVAHDFNNILGIILSNAENMSFSETVSDGKIADIVTACERGARLTRSLLTFARETQLEIRVVNLNKLNATLLDWSRRLFSEDIEVIIQQGKDLWNVRTDTAMTENVILNLMLNARDAMPDGGRIWIETENRVVEFGGGLGVPETARFVVLRISDNGEGIPADAIDRIFEPFYTTKAPGKGSGFGLSVVHGFMEQIGGSVHVTSKLGKGTAFELFFPATDGKADVEKKLDLDLQKASVSARILLVEDQPELRAAVQLNLEFLGYEVVHADTGEEAYKIFPNLGQIDLLITDVVMPGRFNGIELADKLRKIAPNMGVLLMSGYALDRQQETVSRSDYRTLVKPVSLKQLSIEVKTELAEMRAQV